ncbi:hypothetical protein XELAEV_18023978mg [Xenopus laevis]|uniref:Uncharacterized protein n=1 Tax=Xenopus laevis TaxID=8355 RepID=A0A974D552_XENLA|nr:hypothetical protein XELAEV_18023978mg [Xenopus laevis]
MEQKRGKSPSLPVGRMTSPWPFEIGVECLLSCTNGGFIVTWLNLCRLSNSVPLSVRDKKSAKSHGRSR